MRVGQHQGCRAVREVPDFGLHPSCFSVRYGLFEHVELPRNSRMGRFVGVREMRPEADHLDVAIRLGLKSRVDERRPVVRGSAGSGQAGVCLEVKARCFARFASCSNDFVNRPGGVHRDIDVVYEGVCPWLSRRRKPGEDATVDASLSQRNGLLGHGRAEPGGACFLRRARTRDEAVPVCVSLDDSHEVGRARAGAKLFDVAAYCVEVYAGLGAKQGERRFGHGTILSAGAAEDGDYKR